MIININKILMIFKMSKINFINKKNNKIKFKNLKNKLMIK